MDKADQGYSIDEMVFERSEMVLALGALAQTDLARTKAGVRHILHVPIVRELATDSRLLSIAKRFVGSAACDLCLRRLSWALGLQSASMKP